jgi:hypothetical protein
MFLVGGPAFSGTTLLSLLLNQGSLVCLDEPDFHNPEQNHRGVPFLKSLFPEKQFPERSVRPLSYAAAVGVIEACERAIHPQRLGIKTCDQVFIRYGEIFKSRGSSVIAIVRDIRDALVRPLPPWINEAQLNQVYRLVWNHLSLYDLWFRYEDLVTEPDRVMQRISTVLNYPLRARLYWDAEAVHDPMLKLDRHDLLKAGRISRDRIGIWKNSGMSFSSDTIRTARMMGY